MKKMMMTALLMTIAITASAMSYTEARREALFLSDKMAYELDLTAPQYEAVYEINLDYMLSLGHHADLFGSSWSRRNADLMFVLTAWQWDRFRALDYFYRPVGWNLAHSTWTFGVYVRYPHHNVMYHKAPRVYSSYRGGHAHDYGRSWRNGVRVEPAPHHKDMNRPGVGPGHDVRPKGPSAGPGKEVRPNRLATTTHKTVTTTTMASNNHSGHSGGNRSFGNGGPKRNNSVTTTTTTTHKTVTSGGHFGGARR